jgi:hypothetical protein
MRQVAAFAVAALVLAVPQAAAKTGVPSQLLAFIGSGTSVSFVKLDALTLKAVSKAAPVGTPNPTYVATVSGGGRAAIATGRAAIRFVDMRTMRWEFQIAYPGVPAVALWNYADKLVTVNQGSTAEVIVIDPTKRRLGAIRPLGASLVASESNGDQIVALIAPLDGIGPAKLAVIDDRGRVRTAPLPGIRAGSEMLNNGEQNQFEYPALAANGDRAVVIAADGTVADIRLDSLSTTMHVLSRPLAHVHKFANGSSRTARFVDANVIALTGGDDAFDGTTQHATPAGLTRVDVRDWSLRALDADTSALALSGFGPGCIVCTNVLVGYGANGLAVYDRDGTPMFRLFAGTSVRPTAVAGAYVYIGGSTHFTIVDTWTGTIVKTVDTAVPTLLAQSWSY